MIVLLEVALLGKLAWAKVALVWLSAIMQPEVIKQVAALLKALVAISHFANVVRSAALSLFVQNPRDFKPVSWNAIKDSKAASLGLV